MRDKPFSYIWQYRVRADRRSEFLDAYRPGGAWTALFSRDASWVDTRLLCDVDDPDRFVTVDTWLSRAARDEFRRRYAKEFEALDRKCAALTVREDLVGDFEQVDEAEGP